MFTDYTKIIIKSGDGGNGAIAFHREKYESFPLAGHIKTANGNC